MADDNDGTGSHKRKLRKALDAHFKAALDDPSHDILTQVREGTLTRAQADRWANLQGRAPFTSKPPPTTYEPWQSRNWTLVQMTAWVVWRTDDAVRDVSEEYVARCVEWIEVRSPRVRFVHPDNPEPTPTQDRVGYELGSPKVKRPNDVLTSARDWVLLQCDPVPYLAPEQARQEIIDALQVGDPLVARYGEGEAIDRHLWDVLSPFHNGDGPHDAVFYPSGKMVRFHRVRVERDAVLKRWKKLTKKPNGKQRGPIPHLIEGIKAQMRADFKIGKLKKTAIKSKLYHTYGGKRTTCEAAFRDVVSEFETPTKSGNY